MKHTLFLLFFIGSIAGVQAQHTLRTISPKDVYLWQQIQNPRISPDGKWVLYNLSKADSAKDAFYSRLYMVSIDGKETICLTEQTKNPGAANWSPDGKYISFITKPKPEANASDYRQVFVMDRRGGEPMQLTEVKGDIESYSWSNDGKRLVLVIGDPSTADTAKSKVRKPYEIDRYKFKQDYEGYLDNRKSHLYLFDLATKKLDTLTKGKSNEADASFSNDGNSIVYVSNITEDPDRNSNTDIFILDLKNNNKITQLTTFKGSNSSPRFSADDNSISFLQTTSEDNFNMYDQTQLCVADLKTGKINILSASLDRPIVAHTWAGDSKMIYALVEDDRKQNILKFDAVNGGYGNVTNAEAVYNSLSVNKAGQLIALFSDPNTPNEIYAFENDKPRKLTSIQADYVANTKKVFVKGIQAIASDKNLVTGILYLPDSNAKKMPLILFIHGGPVAQDEYSFDQSRQVLAAAGFAVAAVNYRGSSGRGYVYSKAIYADWGNKEVKDIIAIANQLIKDGIADSSKLAIGGWSYGGILTNYTIATDKRFKAAVSGAGSSFQFTMYGTDQYVMQYDEELGAPWNNFKKWVDLSYPYLKVNQIKTPTLFMASQNDFNVPVAGAEQMYQAFKHVGIPTELVIYPNQNHGVSVPSYIIHRYQRHIDWYNKFLK
jgi:dipeptidyl aminopeptidase/acylaminoacyl peptidase